MEELRKSEPCQCVQRAQINICSKLAINALEQRTRTSLTYGCIFTYDLKDVWTSKLAQSTCAVDQKLVYQVFSSGV